ncbi:cytochrome P450 [Aspergillus ellipticus CBS 707.79]|uniref:Cytochrome P450 n=1 Tax=Aspergillus ellipticus CBS 707.79 TaxID=1448320 RepID=A0A319DKQ1_9EURO|nr:cytochrome P450 [Aspergillus ellipticus CBS 707.79]
MQEPFALTIAGKRYYVITTPANSRLFFSDATALTLDGFLNRVLVGFGCGLDRIPTLWQANPPTPLNPKGKNLINLTEDLFKHHLLPGPTFDILVERYRGALRDLLSWDRLTTLHPMMDEKRTKPISLYDLCSEFMINATQMSLFDPVLFQIDPSMTTHLRTFTDEIWKLLHPSRLVDRTVSQQLLRQYTAAFLTYLRLPADERKNETWLIKTILETYEELGIHETDRAAMLVMIYWAGDANAYKAAFWVLSYILYDPQLRKQVRQETAPAVGPDGGLDMAYLVDRCPRLSSIYHEVLRLTKRDVVFRQVVRDTQIGGKHLRKENYAMIASCQLHENCETYGADAVSFNPDRFLKQPELAHQPGFYPYGGGKYYCPGRYFATVEIYGFVALMLNHYQMELAVPGELFPRRDESLLTFGISRPVPGDDLHVRLTRRT